MPVRLTYGCGERKISARIRLKQNISINYPKNISPSKPMTCVNILKTAKNPVNVNPSSHINTVENHNAET